MTYSIQTKHRPNGLRSTFRWVLLGGITMATMLYPAWPQSAQAQVSEYAPPGTIMLELYCRFGDGGYVGHDFDKGVIGSQAYTNDISSTAKFISLGSIGGRFLRLNKVSNHFWKGGYTGASVEFDEELVVTFTVLTCTKGQK